MIYERIYTVTPDIKKWHKQCLQMDAVSLKPSDLAQQLNHMFRKLYVSHLYILTPEQTKWAWQGVKKKKDKWVDVDESPTVVKLNNYEFVLKLRSFRGDYFVDKKWLKVVDEIKPANKLYIDLRGNQGGNFVAMLRVLSSFYCEPSVIGRLVNNNYGAGSVELKNQLPETTHSKVLADKKEVILKTFNGYGCLTPEIHILVDKATGSTSEILAESLQGQKNAKVYGPGTAGGVVMGMNYAIEFWPEEYTLSIPEALYVNHKGQALEGVGLLMDEIEYPISDDLF